MTALAPGNYALSRWEMLKAQWRVILALMLHDIRSRFGGNALGFLMMGVGWPLSHIFALIGINAALGRAAPYGDSTALWYATGVVPFLVFQYMSRWIMLGIVVNRPLMTFPILKTTDIIFAQALTEILNAGLIILVVSGVFWAFDITFMPTNIVQAAEALVAMGFLGLAYGVICAIVAGAYPFCITLFFLFQLIWWIASGILFVPDALPSGVRIALSYFPPLQGVEWMRSAYYDGYGASVLDKTYLLSISAIALFVGLALERMMRGRLLQA